MNEEDYVTIRDMGWARHNGTFRIVDVSIINANTIVLSVDNPDFNYNDFNEVDAGGLAGVFTDQLRTSSTSEFVFGDTIESDLFRDSFILETITSSSDTLVVNGVVSPVDVPLGLRLIGTRTSSIIPLRDDRNVPRSANVVQGDVLNYTDIERLLRVSYVNVQPDRTVSVVGDGSFALVELTTGTTADLQVGTGIFLTNAERFSGEHTITRIVSSTVVEVESSIELTTTGTLIGNYVQIDEQLTWTDFNTQVQVPSRWIPIEAPTDNFELTPRTIERHLDVGSYINQEIVRSTMVNDNMYFTNGSDEVMKFDGNNLSLIHI